jgi:hypothetical protein
MSDVAFSFHEHLAEPVSNFVQARGELVVGEANDAQVHRIDRGRACGVVLSLPFVDAAVDLDDQAPLGAVEVGNEGAQAVLPSKLEAVDPSVSHKLPETALSLRLRTAQLTCSFGRRDPFSRRLRRHDDRLTAR